MNRSMLLNQSLTLRLIATWFTWGVVSGIPFSCKGPALQEDPLARVLASPDSAIARVMADPDAFELQIRYTRIERRGDSVLFTPYEYGVDDGKYFYPASTAKLPVAILALEKLNASPGLDRHMRYYVEGDSVEASFEEDIRAIFAVSDNHANNRLYEFLGRDAINDSLASKNIGPARIAHRLGYHREEASTLPLVIYLSDTSVTQLPAMINRPVEELDLKGIRKGRGFIEDGEDITEPFDFSRKNYLPVRSLESILKRVVFPGEFLPAERFQISGEQREFLLESMKLLPREAGYDPEHYPDGYCKFFIYGDSQQRIPEHLEIYNKVGFAYGTLTDCAYIADRSNGVEFLLTATLLVNRDGIFNDDQYEYDEIGLPFLAALGRQIYEFERQSR